MVDLHDMGEVPVERGVSDGCVMEALRRLGTTVICKSVEWMSDFSLLSHSECMYLTYI